MAVAVTAATPAPTGAGSAGAWMVQLGSFANRTNAEHLARQVRAQGFEVKVSQGSSGRRLYRVRVGPARDRAAATQLAQKLHASGHNGALVPK
jgi:cell division protein FtsN